MHQRLSHHPQNNPHAQRQIATGHDRLQKLNDVLHAMKLRPVIADDALPQFRLPKPDLERPCLVGKTRPFSTRRVKSRQLPKWIPKQQRRVIMAMLRENPHIQSASRPLHIGQQMAINLTNRMVTRGDPERNVDLVLRSVPLMWDKPRFDDVKVAVLAPDGTSQRLYFAR